MWHRYGIFSWWWAHTCPKHVEKSNKHIKKICAPVGSIYKRLSNCLWSRNVKNEAAWAPVGPLCHRNNIPSEQIISWESDSRQAVGRGPWKYGDGRVGRESYGECLVSTKLQNTILILVHEWHTWPHFTWRNSLKNLLAFIWGEWDLLCIDMTLPRLNVINCNMKTSMILSIRDIT